MQGITRTFKSYSDSSAGQMVDVITTMASSYVGQFFPTLGGQIARTIDPVRRSTYASKESLINKGLEQFLRKIANKIPFLSMLNEPMVNMRGEEMKQPDNPLSRAFLNMVSPGFYATGKETLADKEIKRLYNITQSDEVIPKVTPTKFNNDGKTFLLDGKSMTDFTKVMGTTSYELLEQLFETSSYKRASTEVQASLVADVYKYSYALAKEKYLRGQKVAIDDEWYLKIKRAKVVDVNPVKYLEAKNIHENTKEQSFTTKKQEYMKALKVRGFTFEQTIHLMESVGGYKMDERTMNELRKLYNKIWF